MQDKSINNALLELRAQIIRGGLEGREHVEALLLARGVNLQPARKPCRPRHGRNYARLLILEALRSGPMHGRAIAGYAVARVPEVPQDALRRLVSSGLWKMGHDGSVVRDGGVWRLAAVAGTIPIVENGQLVFPAEQICAPI